MRIPPWRVLQALSVALLISACSGHVGQIETTASGHKFERIYNDLGGFVANEHAAWKARAERHNLSHFVIDGNCASFCSFIALAAPRSCYTPSARLGVHPAAIAGMVETAETRKFTESLVALWPKGLQDWWASNRPTVLGHDLLYDDLKRIIPERECGPDFQAG